MQLYSLRNEDKSNHNYVPSKSNPWHVQQDLCLMLELQFLIIYYALTSSVKGGNGKQTNASLTFDYEL